MHTRGSAAAELGGAEGTRAYTGEGLGAEGATAYT